MSLYNTVMGHNPLAAMCLAILKLPPDDVPRFRDAWFADDGQTITVLTRTGGGNRKDYVVESETLRQVPGYVDDADDDFDATFAHFHFAVPEQIRAETRTLAEIMSTIGGGADQWGPAASVRRVTATDVMRRAATPEQAETARAATKRILDYVHLTHASAEGGGHA